MRKTIALFSAVGLVAILGIATLLPSAGASHEPCQNNPQDSAHGTDGSDTFVDNDRGPDSERDCWGLMNGFDVAKGQGGFDVIRGGGGGDDLYGGDGKDVVDGGDGDLDLVEGGPGDDVLIGGPGSGDVCRGEAGQDTEGAGCEHFTQ